MGRCCEEVFFLSQGESPIRPRPSSTYAGHFPAALNWFNISIFLFFFIPAGTYFKLKYEERPT